MPQRDSDSDDQNPDLRHPDMGHPDRPPVEPPAGVDTLIWRLAHGLYSDHRPHIDGFCVTCRAYWPCPPHRLAARAFAVALRTAGVRPSGPSANAGYRY